MVSVTTASPNTGFVKPSNAELESLASIVFGRCPHLKSDGPDAVPEFTRAFLVVGLMYRLPVPSKKRYFGSFVDDANEILIRWGMASVTSSAFLAAALAHGDIPWQSADPTLGALLEIGLDPHTGLKCTNAWRAILAGQAFLPPVPPAELKRRSDALPPVKIYQESHGQMKLVAADQRLW